MAQDNALLEEMSLAGLNRHAVKPADDQDLHRALELGFSLEEVLCV